MELDPAFYYAHTSDMPVSLTAWLCVKMYTSVEHDLCPTCYERPPVLSDRFWWAEGVVAQDRFYCISNMIFSCLSLHPSQHLHFCCIYPSLITFPYRPTFPSICHCRSNCRFPFIYLVLQCFRDLFVTDDTRHFAPPIPARLNPTCHIFLTSSFGL